MENGRLPFKVCHFSGSGPESAVATSTVVGRTAVKMAELPMKSAIRRLLVATSPRVAEGLCYRDNLTVTQVIKNRRL